MPDHPQSAQNKALNWALIVGTTFPVAAIMALVPMLPFMLRHYANFPNAGVWVPLALSAPGLGAAVAAPLAGYAGDRIGRRIPLVFFALAYTIAGMLPFALDSLAAILLARFVVGMAGTGVLVLSIATVGDLFEGERRDRYLAGQAIAATCAALAVVPVAGFFGEVFGWRGSFLLFAIGLPIAAVFLSMREPTGLTAARAAELSASPAMPWRWVASMSATFALAAILFNAVQTQLGLSLAALGILDAGAIGLLSMVALAGIPVGSAMFVRFARVPFARLFRFEVFASATTLMLLGGITDYRLFLGVAFLNNVANGLMLPTLITHVTRVLPPSVRARGTGMTQSAFAAGQFACLGLSALITHTSGGTVLYAFGLIGAAGIVVALLSWLVRSPQLPSALQTSSRH